MEKRKGRERRNKCERRKEGRGEKGMERRRNTHNRKRIT